MHNTLIMEEWVLAAVVAAVALLPAMTIALLAILYGAAEWIDSSRHRNAAKQRKSLDKLQEPKLDPTAQQINSACLSYDHAFGLMSKDEQELVRFQATEWLRAWQKEGAWQWRK